MNDEGALEISRLLKCNNCLQILRLSNNNITADGASAIAESLRLNTCLLSLCLQGNRIGMNGAVTVSKLLQSNNSLRSLILSRNGTTDYEDEIADILQHNYCLMFLGLKNKKNK